MDTDINNYSIDEIFSIIKVDKDCKLEQLYDTVKSAMNKIESSDESIRMNISIFLENALKNCNETRT